MRLTFFNPLLDEGLQQVDVEDYSIWGYVTTYSDLPLGTTTSDPGIGDLVGVNTTTGTWLIGTQRREGFYKRSALTGVVSTDYGTTPIAGFPLQATQVEVDAGTDDTKYITPLTFTSSNQLATLQSNIDNMIPPSGGYANNLYFSDTADSGGISGYKTLTYTPDVVEIIESHTVNSSEGDKLIHTYIYPTGVSTTLFPSGLWSFRFYGKVDSTVGVTQIGVTYFRRLLDNSEVDLFTIWSNELNNTTNEWISFEVINPTYTVVATDRMGARILLKATHNNDITVTYALGNGYAAYLNNPNKIRHNQLRGFDTDDHTIYALLAGRSGGQIYTGGTLTGNTLTLKDNAVDNNTLVLGSDLTFTRNDLRLTTKNINLNNDTASDAINTVQQSPALLIKSSSWNTTSNSNILSYWRMYSSPSTGLIPQHQLYIQYSNDNSSWTTFAIANTNNFLIPNFICSGVLSAINNTTITTTQTPVLSLKANANATASVTERRSPGLLFQATAWNTTPTASSKINAMTLGVRGISGATTSAAFIVENTTIDGNANTNELFRITSGGLVSIGGIITPSYVLSLLGTAAQTIGMERHTTSDTAGNNINLRPGGATVGATNKRGGTSVFHDGISTGNSTGTSYQFYTYDPTTSGTNDQSETVKLSIASNGDITSNSLTGTNARLVEANASGTIDAVKEIITGKLVDSTTITKLTTDSNWNNLGIYTGTAITGTYEGQYYSSGNYKYFCYSDNTWIKEKINNHIELARYYYFASTTSDVIGDTRTSNQSGWQYLETCTVANATKGGGTWIVTEAKRTVTLTDSNEGEGAGTYVDLISGKSGYGNIVFGNGIGYAQFYFTTTGIVILILNSGNLFTSLQTGTNHVIIKDNGSNVRIVNELGSTTIFTLTINYTN